jgi:hypothetical protein
VLDVESLKTEGLWMGARADEKDTQASGVKRRDEDGTSKRWPL